MATWRVISTTILTPLVVKNLIDNTDDAAATAFRQNFKSIFMPGDCLKTCRHHVFPVSIYFYTAFHYYVPK
jgi:hypothetical protein